MNLKVREVFFILERHNNKYTVIFRGNHLWLLINLSIASRHHVQGVFSLVHQNACAQNPTPFQGLLIGENVMNFCVYSSVISKVSRMMETCSRATVQLVMSVPEMNVQQNFGVHSVILCIKCEVLGRTEQSSAKTLFLLFRTFYTHW